MKKNTIGMYGGKFLPLHMGHVHMITHAACAVDELYVVLSYSKARDEQLVRAGNIKPLPYQLRLRWLSELTKDMGNVKVIAIEDTAIDDETYDWEAGAQAILQAIGKPIDVVFGSERHYEPIFKNCYPTARYCLVDPDRTFYSISATTLRTEGVYKHWAFLPDVVRPYFAKSVVVVGTESCGKSTLVRYLAKMFNTNYVEEYGRTLSEEIGRCEDVMTDEDFYHIAYQHKCYEREAKKQANKVVFVDTESIVTQYYAKLYQGHTLPLLDGIAVQQEYDLWLFLEPDVPWVNDGTRDFGDTSIREQNNTLLKQMLDERGVTYQVIQGGYVERLQQATKYVQSLW